MTDTASQPTGTASPADGRRIARSQWSFGEGFRSGTGHGLRMRDGRLVLRDGVDEGGWQSPWVVESFALTALVASWQAETPGRTWVSIDVRARTADGRVSDWSRFAAWAETDAEIRRHTVANPEDPIGRVEVDTWIAGADDVSGWQLRIGLHRPAGETDTPIVSGLGAVASRLDGAGPRSQAVAGAVLVDVPRYSQMTHRGHLVDFGGGGEAWCSAASTAMVLEHYGVGPSHEELAVVQRELGAEHQDAAVDLTALRVYDDAYRGTGNWSFNTAWAANRAGSAFVTRLPDLAATEPYLAAGIPLILSVRYGDGELAGAPAVWTSGHLLVLVGFTSDGQPVVNDPAADSNDGVRLVYDRAELEQAWADGSGGITYVIHDAAHPLPD